jgi:hypothetical protein
MVTDFVITFVDGRKASLPKVADYNVRPQFVVLRSSAG